MKTKLFITFLSLALLIGCETINNPLDDEPTDETPIDTTPTNGLTANQYKIGSTIYNIITLGWQATGYSGIADPTLSNMFKAIFSKKGPVTGNYKVVSVPSALSTVADGEIGIYVVANYLTKAITPNTGSAKVTHTNGVVTIMVNDVTIGADKFNAHYVIGKVDKYVYVDNNSLDPMESISRADGGNFYAKIKTYGSQLSDFETWSFHFYFGKTSTLADGTYTSVAFPTSGLNGIEASKVYVLGESSFQSFKSDASSGTITVSKNKITFNSFKIKTADKTITLRGEYQF
jgi:hypothetical protein